MGPLLRLVRPYTSNPSCHICGGYAPGENYFFRVRENGQDEEQMSRANISSMVWLPEEAGLFVTFELHHGPEGGSRTYLLIRHRGETNRKRCGPSRFAGVLGRFAYPENGQESKNDIAERESKEMGRETLGEEEPMTPS